MRRSNLLIYMISVGLGVGCAPRPKVVYVDLMQAQLSDPTIWTEINEQPPSAKPIIVQGGSSKVLPSEGSKTVTFPLTRERLDQARETVRKSEEQAIRDLSRKLRSSYMAEIAQIEQERLRKIDPRKQDQVEAGFAKIRPLFEDYASKRGPIVAELAFRAGFPDPDPQSLRAPDEEDKRRMTRYRKTKSLRDDLANIENQYQTQIKAIFDEIDAQNLKELGDLRVEMEEMRAKKEQEADAEAKAQMQTVRDKMKSLLIGSPSVTLPALGSVKSQVPRTEPLRQALLSPQTHSDQAESLQSDLRIWLSVKHYVLGEPSRAHNATQEFIEWRRKHLGGR